MYYSIAYESYKKNLNMQIYIFIIHSTSILYYIIYVSDLLMIYLYIFIYTIKSHIRFNNKIIQILSSPNFVKKIKCILLKLLN